MAETPATTTSHAVAKRWDKMSLTERQGDFKRFLTDNQAALKMALPKHINPDRLIKVFLTAITANPKILECSKESIVLSLMQAAEVGLEPNSPLEHCYVIPYKGMAQFQMSYKGFIELANRSETIEQITGVLVFEGEPFEYRIDNGNVILQHTPAPWSTNKSWKGLMGAYLIVRRRGSNFPNIHFLSKAEIDKRRAVAQTQKVWDQWPLEMALKTIYKFGLKKEPRSIELVQAIAGDDAAEAGKIADLSQEMADALLATGEFDPNRVEAESTVINGEPNLKDKLKAKAEDVGAGPEQVSPEYDEWAKGEEPKKGKAGKQASAFD